MKLTQFLKKHPLDDSLLIGFYGGGNYGDELLLEVLAGLLKKQGAKRVSVAYQKPELYSEFHHDFGFTLVDMHSKRQLLRAIFTKKRIVFGGGGLWGMDSTVNLLLLSIVVFFARWLLGKKVYLLAVGYYNSATRIGRIGAWFAGKAANCVVARDTETYENFKRIQRNTYKDADIAWYISELDLLPYQANLKALEKRVRVSEKTLFITLRRFHTEPKYHLAAVIGQCLQNNADKPIILALMEPQRIDPSGYELLQSWQQNYPNLQILDFSFNPLALFLFFRAHSQRLVFIGPQFHAILSAHLTGVPFLPIVYDNKVRGLLKHIAPKQPFYALPGLRAFDVQRFIDQSYNKAI